MATVGIKAVIYSQYKKRDGTYPIRLRITFKRKVKFISTNIVAVQSQLTRNLNIKDPQLAKKVNDFVLKTYETIGQIDPFSIEHYSIDDIIDTLMDSQDKGFRLNFIRFFEGIADDKQGHSRETYRCAVRAFKSFIGTGSLDISEFTSSLLRKYEGFLKEKYGQHARAVSAYLSALRYAHGQVRARYNNEESGEILIRNPFDYYSIPKQAPASHRNMDESVIARMLSDRHSLEGIERIGVDIYLISFSLMGMNCPDIFTCHWADGMIAYNRTKTSGRRADKALMMVEVQNCAKFLIDEYADPTGERVFRFYKDLVHYQSLGRKVNNGLLLYQQRIGLEKRLTLYTARHTWATAAYRAGIDKALINDCLCHVDTEMKVTDIYIEKDWNRMAEVNKKVLSLFNWQ